MLSILTIILIILFYFLVQQAVGAYFHVMYRERVRSAINGIVLAFGVVAVLAIMYFYAR